MKQTIIAADYSALEVVVLGDLTLRLFGDDQLAKATSPGAPDIHAVNARFIFGEYLGWTIPEASLVEGVLTPNPYAGQRVDVIPVKEFKKHPFGAIVRGMNKTVFYGWCYGKRGYGFATLPGPDGKPIGEELGDKLVEGLVGAMPGLGKLETWIKRYVDKWRGVYSLGGRWCPLYDETEDNAPEWLRNRGYRKALNFPCQASAAEIMGDAMVRIDGDEELADLGWRCMLQVHDEWVGRGPEETVERAKQIVVSHMVSATANGTKLLVPLQVSANHGDSYFEAK